MCQARPGGSYLYLCCQGRRSPTKLPAEAKSTPGSPGRGFLCAILADPQTNARAGRNPSLKILPTLPHDASARSRPTTAPDASPSCARPSPTRRRRSRPGYAPGNGGAAVNCSPTFGTPMPAADPRTGRGESAPRGTQYHTGVPFAALPHDIAADPRLTPTDLRVLATLLFYARQKTICYPSDDAIAARVHRHPGTVRRSLKRLEDIGYLHREFLPPSPANPTGRLIHMTCMEPDWPRPNQTTAPAPTPAHGAHPHPAPAHRWVRASAQGGRAQRTPKKT